jgi:hypothetical protein
VNFSTQSHDFNPGFGPPVNAAGDRLFWTTEIPNSAVRIDFGAGRAEMHVHDLAIEDYFNFPNASIPGDEVDATVSFDVVWDRPITRRYNVTDAANGFAGSFVENQATITWSASNELGFTFVADPGSFATSVPEAGPIALLGHERNGTFFPAGSAGPELTGLRGGGEHPGPSSPAFGGDILAHHPGRGGTALAGVGLLLHPGGPAGAAQTPTPGGSVGQDAEPHQGAAAVRQATDAVFASWQGEGEAPWSLGHGWAPRRGRR